MRCPKKEMSSPMTSTERPPRPRFIGVDTYADPHGRFTFRYPSDWYRFALDNGLEGVLFSPERENPQTFFSAWVRRLDAEAVAEDLPLLQKGVAEGLAQLPQCVVESSSDDTYGNLIKFERIYTFRDGDDTRKRKVWIMYVAQWQIVLTYQGRTPEEWEYWLPWQLRLRALQHPARTLVRHRPRPHKEDRSAEEGNGQAWPCER